MPQALALSLGTALVVASVAVFSFRGALAGTNLFLVFQALPGEVWGFPLMSAGVALILGALLDCERALSRISFPGVAATATLSYSLYLTHKSVYNLDKMFFGVDNLQGVSGFVIYLVTSFLAGFALWYCVERSFLKLRDRLLSAGVSKSA
jgi:peptidoglycan/LPS O-acetylase OafA/YrhL